MHRNTISSLSRCFSWAPWGSHEAEPVLHPFLLSTRSDGLLKAFLSGFVAISCFCFISKAMTLSWKEIRFVWHDLVLKKAPVMAVFLGFLLSVGQNAVTHSISSSSRGFGGQKASKSLEDSWPNAVINTLLFPAGAKTHEQLLSLLTRKRSGLFNKIYLYFPFRSNGNMLKESTSVCHLFLCFFPRHSCAKFMQNLSKG